MLDVRYIVDLLIGDDMVVFFKKKFSMITCISSRELWSMTEMPRIFGRCTDRTLSLDELLPYFSEAFCASITANASSSLSVDRIL